MSKHDPRILPTPLDGPPTRLRYFFGKRLTADDLELEQRYHRLQQLLTGQLTGYGVVSGLGATLTPSTSPSTQNTLKIAPGVALDGDGRLAVLSEEMTIDLDAWEASLPTTLSSASNITVVLKVVDRLGGWEPAPRAPHDPTDGGECGLVVEQATLELVTSWEGEQGRPPGNPDDPVLLEGDDYSGAGRWLQRGQAPDVRSRAPSGVVVARLEKSGTWTMSGPESVVWSATDLTMATAVFASRIARLQRERSVGVRNLPTFTATALELSIGPVSSTVPATWIDKHGREAVLGEAVEIDLAEWVIKIKAVGAAWKTWVSGGYSTGAFSFALLGAASSEGVPPHWQAKKGDGFRLAIVPLKAGAIEAPPEPPHPSIDTTPTWDASRALTSHSKRLPVLAGPTGAGDDPWIELGRFTVDATGTDGVTLTSGAIPAEVEPSRRRWSLTAHATQCLLEDVVSVPSLNVTATHDGMNTTITVSAAEAHTASDTGLVAQVFDGSSWTTVTPTWLTGPKHWSFTDTPTLLKIYHIAIGGTQPVLTTAKRPMRLVATFWFESVPTGGGGPVNATIHHLARF